MGTTVSDKTREVIATMLKENTGRHFLDSGDYYGRHWERNQHRDFEREPEAWLEIWDGKPVVTINVYHFLVRCLEYDPDLDRLFQEFADLPENRKKPWPQVMEEFPDWYGERVGVEPTGLWGGGAPLLVNTYNGEDLLSQVLQYVYFEINDRGYVILQIHNGCDVRGGYTRPRVFLHDDDYMIFDNARAGITCEGGHVWYTDDGYHWYADGCSPGPYPRLEELELKEPEDGGPVKCPLCGKPLRVFI